MKLLDEVRCVARLRRLALQTERCYVRRDEQDIRFHRTSDGFRHPNRMGAEEVERFFTDLAVRRRVSASTQNQAFADNSPVCGPSRPVPPFALAAS